MKSDSRPFQKKSMGQVFLKVEWPVERMVQLLKDWGVKRVAEIGPGAGILTRGLRRAGMDVTAIEKDQRFAAMMAEEARSHPEGWGSLEVAGIDVLKFDWSEWRQRDPRPAAICGNIPYNISSPILQKTLPHLGALRGMSFMTQQEFAARIAAQPGTKDYGSLSVFVQLRSIPRMEFKVGRGCFHPVPKVDSAVFSLRPKEDLLPELELERIEIVTRTAFGQRRKKLRNSIAEFLQVQAESDSPVDLSRRAESLTPEEFVALTRFLFQQP